MAGQETQKANIEFSIRAEQDIPAVPTEKPKKQSKGKVFSEVEGRAPEFIWNPYIPKDEVTIIYADGGIGKNQVTCGIISHFADGHLPLNFDLDEPIKTVFFSGEDKVETDFYARLSKTKNRQNIMIFDKEDSAGFSFENAEKCQEILDEAQDFGAKIIVIDPIQNFIGTSVDMNRMNQVRPRMQSLAKMAGAIHGSVILISHVNKRVQGENANHSVMGSVDIANASRSALQIVEDDRDPEIKNRRLLIHTKSNGAPYGQTILFEITSEGVNFLRYEPDITKETLTASARCKKTIGEYLEWKRTNNQRTNIEADRLSRIYETILYLGEHQQKREQKYTMEDIESTASSRYGTSGKLFPNGRCNIDIETLHSKLLEQGYKVSRASRIHTGQMNESGNEIRANGILLEKVQKMTQKHDPNLLEEDE